MRARFVGPAAAGGRAPLLAAGGLALLLAVAYLLAPPMGTDLSAQVARAAFVARYGAAPIDLGWYGGTVQYGYSLLTPGLMALLGVGPTGALALVVSALAFAGLLTRTDAVRPMLGGLLGAACIAGNLVSGRTTYAVGVAFGLLALLALTASRQWVRLAGGAAGALLASAASPVAGLFVGLGAVALLASARFGDRGGARDATGAGSAPAGRTSVPAGVTSLGTAGPASAPSTGSGAAALLVAVAAAVPLAVNALLFGEGGWMNISRADLVHAVVASLAVAVVVRRPPVRIGAVLSAAGVLAAFAVHTPVGLNATRLATMFALPVVAAYAEPLRWGRPGRSPGLVLAAALVALAAWQPPVNLGDLRDAGNPTAQRSYFAPLRAELDRRQPVGRIEVPPTRDYWEAAYATPVARGWLRQVDLARNRLFFDGGLTADRYQAWLADNGVRYVAVADAEPSWVGRSEVKLVRGGLPYLSEVWRGGHWVLYEVAGEPAVVDGATLIGSTNGALTIDVEHPGTALVRLRWSRWLTVDGPAPATLAATGRWTTLDTTVPGRYTVSSGLVSDRRPRE
ncbi:MAG: hypothetical protein QOE03_3670 [Micromonosporaceae bacterium]|nr:hypothetical protein [Micromonosporaceae bacterium]